MGALGRQATLKAVEGEPVAVTSNDWVDITDENRTGFDVSILETERSRNAGGGRTAHDLTGHAEGTVGTTLDSTSVSRQVFAAGGGRRVSFLYSPEGDASGSPYEIYQTLVGVSKAHEAQGAVVYTVSGDIEVEPTFDDH